MALGRELKKVSVHSCLERTAAVGLSPLFDEKLIGKITVSIGFVIEIQ